MSPSSKAAVFRAIAQTRRSVNRFQTDKNIHPDVLGDILKSTIRSPSSFNLQPSQIVLVQNTKVKQELSTQAMLGPGNQYRTRDCSALAVFLSDLEASKRIQRIYQLEQDWGQRHPAYLAMMPLSTSFLLGEGHAATWIKQLATYTVSEATQQPMPSIDGVDVWAAKQTALLAQSYVLAAASHDLATCMMEGFDVRKLKEILRIPDRYSVPMVVATGYDFETSFEPNEKTLTPRLSMEEVVFADVFGEGYSGESVDADDSAMEESLDEAASS